ncbi:MAG: ArdC family protein [Ignavibacteriaceae bacterium]
MEEGVLPWRKSWKSGLPMNFITKNAYQGINFLMLIINNYPSPYYLTYLQCNQKQGLINKGEHGSQVIYYSVKPYPDRKNPDELKNIPILRYSTVFNLSQTNLYKLDTDKTTILSCEEVIAKMACPPVIRNNIGRCYYVPGEDFISLPAINDFDSSTEYYSGLFHELIHWTGNSKRLNRLPDRKDADSKIAEELIAEIGSSYLCGLCGIESSVLDNQASYIASWLKGLNDDPMLIVNASVAAQKAVNFILGNLEPPKKTSPP